MSQEATSNWWNALHKEEGWFDDQEETSEISEHESYYQQGPLEPEYGKIEKYEAKNFDKGCRICGGLNGLHGFSFDSRKAK